MHRSKRFAVTTKRITAKPIHINVFFFYSSLAHTHTNKQIHSGRQFELFTISLLFIRVYSYIISFLIVLVFSSLLFSSTYGSSSISFIIYSFIFIYFFFAAQQFLLFRFPWMWKPFISGPPMSPPPPSTRAINFFHFFCPSLPISLFLYQSFFFLPL